MRIDNIFEYLYKFHQKDELELENLKGCTVKNICEATGYARTAVSEDLSKLTDRHQVIKIKTRPVLFFVRSILEKSFFFSLRKDEYDSLEELETEIRQEIEKKENLKQEFQNNPFLKVIGYDGSLADSIKKLKAAVLYPPKGLNVMLTGESGVGKTLLAEHLHKFFEAKTHQKVPFIYFNCAEYFNNPELLTSHLFGYKKGSFTGADNDHQGLVELADGGFFFLDEVHRLTNEGQEKLFTLLDKGYFTRMGEAEKQRHVSIKFIFATTEELEKTFLKTFLRRIPVNLHIPNLSERSIKEKIQLILTFFMEEGQGIQKDIFISYNTLKYLVFSKYKANVGELKSEIQFICAQAYLDAIDYEFQELTIDLPLSMLDENTIDTKDIVMLNEYVPNQGIKIQHDYFYPHIEQLMCVKGKQNDRFYNFLLNEYTDLKNVNVSSKDAIAMMQNKLDQLYDMDLFSQSFSDSHNIDDRFYHQINQIVQYIEEEMNILLPENLKDVLAAHIYSSVFYSAQIDDVFFDLTKNIFSGKIENYQLAEKTVNYIENYFALKLPNTEIIFYDLFIRKIKSTDRRYELDEKCGIIVVAHGSATASSMVEYTNVLFSTSLMNSVNMPINQSVEETLDKVRNMVRNNGYSKLILMVDIGSLVYFGNVISKEFQIEVLLISNINLLTLLEVAREAIYESTSFDYLLPVLKEKNHKVLICRKGNFEDSKVLVISCLTGLGTALKIEKLLLNTFPQELLTNIRIITLEKKELENLTRLLSFVHEDEKLVGIIGTVKTEVPDVPFISLDNLLSDHGIQLVFQMLGFDLTKDENKEIFKRISAKYIQGLSIEAITDLLSILNPKSITIELSKIYSDICMQTKKKSDEKRLLRFIIHCACMIERQIQHPEYDHTSYELSYRDLPELASVIKMAFRPIEVSYKIVIPPLEVKYIYELLFEVSM
ncbi:sigma 54-interacting transcriptional regulator [Enterococcus dongliensis]|uniref:Sigma 54-interacting transcriptional regulator n=1 Tax=Enterococcus dongliensis TaxID=2559925 RepID=A0AAW8TPN5_9ENTE|nr:sigma 54-interacting transcriptional regulator [Enterococcus dongliensis]MDT2597517.1 sigma 54-interacting transcriptional regulator [Enterococcus dongliensis]MDT2604712.1 sigma 54-interacting transcriptional regulator [Enterococcus dongliensis]MDT2635374.1 sigma 54-interacting transcriptional regulator [Enterococcus dongliensis]MDT2638240.1 sigma 54-interacting transcriptional regulator [Enterococcus dongliensis]MDT2640357.1 sigma 54-interacting transcriptional regulator [Enterococcus dong